ncbi:SbcC/MukB-like Walker B domain-containing protein [Streptomyces sp. SBT349]|uniref:SbcC/MukB-like Walker B domain-containing protein n=1 Tax=Streptomyces sp. SBT349 TaxID=1580539 RepID=UPI00066E5886|nr:SbcC/MukB-like Walker B domain-containing protein [Streptomyces sp. SBT349]
MSDILDLNFTTQPPPVPSGNAGRFGGRWRLVGAGLSNVWRYGDLDLPAASGRLLLRGPNGTGKTTALEALWPYLLDLNAAKLAAGKARPTTLKLLMSEGAPAKGRRYGYLWLSFAGGSPAETALAGSVVTFGARLQYSPSASPPVTVVPFTVPGRPLYEVALRAPGGGAWEHDDFCNRIQEAGGRVFEGPDAYVEHLAARIWSTTAEEVRELASRLREVRNPSLLGDVSPAAAAAALRQSLPGVAGDVLTATADALAEFDTTREAFERDEHAAVVLGEFSRVWTGHVVDVTRAAHHAASAAAAEVNTGRQQVRNVENHLSQARSGAKDADAEVRRLAGDHRAAMAEAHAIETSDAYKAHGRVTDLRKRLTAERNSAASAFSTLEAAAAHARDTTVAAEGALDEVVGAAAELAEDAVSAGGPPTALDTLLDHRPRARSTRHVADRTVNPGPGLTLTHDRTGLLNLATAWIASAQTYRGTAGKAALIQRDHTAVAEAARTARAAEDRASRAESDHDEATQAAALAGSEAREAARSTLGAVARWAPEHPVLRGLHDPGLLSLDEYPVWEAADIDALADAEPPAVRDRLNAWALQALHAGEALAAHHENAAQNHQTTAAQLADAAAEHRAQARRLREGQLLPLSRPQWAGPGDDDAALGALLEWRSGVAQDQQALLEFALACAGVLSAHLHTGGATTSAWHISPVGPLAEHSLTAVLDVDPDHLQANLARTVLARIALSDSATGGHRHDAALVIGRDGTFAAGPLTANPAAALTSAGASPPAASHIGARTRLARAQAMADELDEAAATLEEQAEDERTAAADRRRSRDTVRSAARSFPPRDALVNAEAERARTAKAAHRLEGTARTLRGRADTAAAEHTRLHVDWIARARDLSLPTTLDELTELITASRTRAEKLESCAKQLTGRLLTTLDRVLRSLPDESTLTARLAELEYAAQRAHDTALDTGAELAEAEFAGDVDDAARRFEAATARAEKLSSQIETARRKATDAEKLLSTRESELETARKGLEAARPRQESTHTHLARLLAWAPISRALDVDAFLSACGILTTDGLGTGSELLDRAGELLARRPTASKKTLGEHYDEVRAELAQTWTIARSDPPADLDELETFVLTHTETQYDPPHAAARAQALAIRAKNALDAAEEAALRDFVIGRLPSAIGTAWTALMDWKTSVNAKMRAAQASSGVGVQVHIGLRDDLCPATRTVYELSCKVGDAVRTEAQKTDVGHALQALLAAADGSTMAERLAAAVDIRGWVDVHYLVERPGPDGEPITRRWGSRTGLSGGERRLVVLAPMLAAIAANYDRLTTTGLRLVPLDEVPAEVDERGREGLARYLAELDVDLLCTSYLWDGAPGAWDGIDAHDLEAGEDGTVVAFPMLVRGLQLLPGDRTDPALDEGPA